MFLDNYFQLSPIPANQMMGGYDVRLVILSYLVAVFASYIALDITARLRDISNTQLSTTFWLFGGAIAMGAGIWSMHFIGMLAFSMNMPMVYDATWTSLSLLVAIGASLFALFILKAKEIHLAQTILGGVILGFAIAAMHYTGMQGMTNHVQIHYLPGLFLLSIVIAIIASEAAIYLALKSTIVIPSMRFRLKFVSAFIMGAAICGMHYTGMAAAVFTPKPHMIEMTSGINPEFMAISIAGVTSIILGIAFVVSTYKESLNQQLLLTARQAGMAEVAASVLHNVGNILNSINVSTLFLSEKINNSQLANLEQLKKLINEHKNNFDSLLKDERGKYLPEFLVSIADYWENEKTLLINEINNLLKNVEHVKNIISTQQDLSRVTTFKQYESIEAILEEAILISGIDDIKNEIYLERHYEKLTPMLIDKVKILQILVNLIQNAKEALKESNNKHKKICFEISSSDKECLIKVIDNGPGIPSNNLTRIFSYGFTTKKSGHGFGLHASAVSATEMGGSLSAASPGMNMGATFTLSIPYTSKSNFKVKPKKIPDITSL